MAQITKATILNVKKVQASELELKYAKAFIRTYVTITDVASLNEVAITKAQILAKKSFTTFKTRNRQYWMHYSDLRKNMLKKLFDVNACFASETLFNKYVQLQLIDTLKHYNDNFAYAVIIECNKLLSKLNMI